MPRKVSERVSITSRDATFLYCELTDDRVKLMHDCSTGRGRRKRKTQDRGRWRKPEVGAALM